MYRAVFIVHYDGYEVTSCMYIDSVVKVIQHVVCMYAVQCSAVQCSALHLVHSFAADPRTISECFNSPIMSGL